MVGRACWNHLFKSGYKNLIGKDSKALDLRNQKYVMDFLKKEKPDIIIHTAAKVGGILANNNYPYEFLMDNMMIQNNIINAAKVLNISRLIFLGSSCIYPKFSEQPINESELLKGPLEETNQWYAIAKISGVKLIEALRREYNRDYVAIMPTNLYGPYDNFDPYSSHVIPGLINKIHNAKVHKRKSVMLWGSGSALREFLFVNDLAVAITHLIENPIETELVNIGSGMETSIKELAHLIKRIIGYEGAINWDNTKPDGTPRKLLDSSLISESGWQPSIDLFQGITMTYDWYVKNHLC